jgi:hypothetical protein
MPTREVAVILAELSNGLVLLKNSSGSEIGRISETSAESVSVQGLEIAIKLQNGLTQIYEADSDEYGANVRHVRTI